MATPASDNKTPAKIEDIFRFGGLSGPIAMTDVTGLVAALAAKADDSLVVKLAGTQSVTGSKTFSLPVIVANQTGTTTGFRFASAATGIFGFNTAPGRLGVKIANQVVLDSQPASGLGATKFQTVPVKCEAGFSGGAALRDTNAFFYLSEGSLNHVDCSAAAVALDGGDDLSDPVFLDAADGAILTFKDKSGTAATNNITITTGGGLFPIDGGTTVTINTAYGYVELAIVDSALLIVSGNGYTLT